MRSFFIARLAFHCLLIGLFWTSSYAAHACPDIPLEEGEYLLQADGPSQSLQISADAPFLAATPLGPGLLEEACALADTFMKEADTALASRQDPSYWAADYAWETSFDGKTLKQFSATYQELYDGGDAHVTRYAVLWDVKAQEQLLWSRFFTDQDGAMAALAAAARDSGTTLDVENIGPDPFAPGPDLINRFRFVPDETGTRVVALTGIVDYSPEFHTEGFQVTLPADLLTPYIAPEWRDLFSAGTQTSGIND